MTMKFQIPDTFKMDNEDYITLVPLKKFIEDNKISEIRKTMHRRDILNGIEKFANESDENQEIVESWIDKTVKNGRKEVYLHFIDKTLFDINRLKNEKLIEEKVRKKIARHRHFSGNRYDEKLKLCKYELEYGKDGAIITLYYCKMIYSIDAKEQSMAQWYPIIVEAYLDKMIMAVKVKQKSSMLQYISGDIDFKDLKTTSPEKEAKTALNDAANMLGLSLEGNAFAESDRFKEKLYKFVSKYTGTPKEIKDCLDMHMPMIDGIVNEFQKKVISLSQDYQEDMKTDIYNTFEKYLSITRMDTNIFIVDEKAYPVRLIAADEEESRVDQAAVALKPLQSKSIFFDNKKMLQKNQKCDGVFFAIKKEGAKRLDDRFLAKIRVKKGYCCLSWSEYLMEGDIDYVIFSIINA